MYSMRFDVVVVSIGSVYQGSNTCPCLPQPIHPRMPLDDGYILPVSLVLTYFRLHYIGQSDGKRFQMTIINCKYLNIWLISMLSVNVGVTHWLYSRLNHQKTIPKWSWPWTKHDFNCSAVSSMHSCTPALLRNDYEWISLNGFATMIKVIVIVVIFMTIVVVVRRICTGFSFLLFPVFTRLTFSIWKEWMKWNGTAMVCCDGNYLSVPAVARGWGEYWTRNTESRKNPFHHSSRK